MVCIVPCEKCVSGFHIAASEQLAKIITYLKVDGREIPLEEIVGSERHLALLGARLCRDGFPYRTTEQIRAEILRLADKFDRHVTNEPIHRTQDIRERYGRSFLWVYSSDDDDDFMPSSKERGVEALRKGKEKKAETSSKGAGKKPESSSKGKGAKSADGAGCIDGR